MDGGVLGKGFGLAGLSGHFWDDLECFHVYVLVIEVNLIIFGVREQGLIDEETVVPVLFLNNKLID